LPMMVKTVKIENIGPIRIFDAEFSEGINIVYGPNGCGKTVLVKTLHEFFSSETGRFTYGLTHGECEGRVTVVPYPVQTMYTYVEARSADGCWTPHPKRCALLDGPADALERKSFNQFLDYVKNRFAQAIITTHTMSHCSFREGRVLKMRYEPFSD